MSLVIELHLNFPSVLLSLLSAVSNRCAGDFARNIKTPPEAPLLPLRNDYPLDATD